MDSVLGEDELDERINEYSDEETISTGKSFVEHFDLKVGRVRVHDEHSDEPILQWKAIASTGESAVSGTMFDAVMGVIEQIENGGV